MNGALLLLRVVLGLAMAAHGAQKLFGWFGGGGPKGTILSVMVVASRTVSKGRGFFAQTGGSELPILYITGALAVAIAGPGVYSLDHVLGLDSLFSQVATVIALAVGVLGALGNLAMRRPTA